MGDGGLARIRNDLVNELIKHYGKGAYTCAVERMSAYCLLYTSDAADE